MLDTYDFSIQHRPGRLHCNADGLPRRLSNNCKRKDCPDCHLGDCVEFGGRADSVPTQLDRNSLSSPAGIIPVRTIERFNSAESGSRNSVDGNSSSPDSEIRPNWLDTWTDDQLRT